MSDDSKKMTRRDLLASGAGLTLLTMATAPAVSADPIPPKLIGYREALRFATGFRSTHCLAFSPEGDVWAAGDGLARLFSRLGHRKLDLKLPAPATCLAPEEDGSIFVGTRKSVLLYGSNRRLKAQWTPPGARAYVTCIAPAGKVVWVADAGSRVVLGYSREGKLLHRVGERNPARKQTGLIVPSPHLDVAADAEGNVWVCNPGRHRMECYSRRGELLRTWGSASPRVEGFWGCCNPTDFVLLPDGRFVTSEKGMFRVKVYSPQGRLQTVVAGPSSFAGSKLPLASARQPVKAGQALQDLPCNGISLDVAADSRGRVLVLDPAGNVARLFVPKGSA